MPPFDSDDIHFVSFTIKQTTQASTPNMIAPLCERDDSYTRPNAAMGSSLASTVHRLQVCLAMSELVYGNIYDTASNYAQRQHLYSITADTSAENRSPTDLNACVTRLERVLTKCFVATKLPGPITGKFQDAVGELAQEALDSAYRWLNNHFGQDGMTELTDVRMPASRPAPPSKIQDLVIATAKEARKVLLHQKVMELMTMPNGLSMLTKVLGMCEYRNAARVQMGVCVIELPAVGDGDVDGVWKEEVWRYAVLVLIELAQAVSRDLGLKGVKMGLLDVPGTSAMWERREGGILSGNRCDCA